MRVPLYTIRPSECFRTPNGTYVRLAGIGFGEDSSKAISDAGLNRLIEIFNEAVGPLTPELVILAIEIRRNGVYRIRPAVLDARMMVTPTVGKPYHPPRPRQREPRR